MDPTADQARAESVAFKDLELHESILKAVLEIGYETPSPIQAATIPHMLAGTDLVGQAQTGTGKTAAFALPILSCIELNTRAPQALVLVPTRELAIQVAEAFQKYATYLKGFHVMPIYGGQSYTPQLQALRRGVHVVVGTPGRVMDHIKKETLDLSALKFMVLDEADEMLRMGFIDDVEWILEQAPEERQIALFSATMPPEVRRIAKKHLSEPAEITIKTKTASAGKIRQRYWMVSGMHKLDALTRILEAEPFDAMLVFTRTKVATEELAEKLQARGYAAEPLNGDIVQAQRERTVARLKSKKIDILVATDVAARGLDVERISHVINFDVPYDPESYIHRIGRTGRAGRSGEAILFIAPRERNMLRVIERATRQPVTPMELPTVQDVNEQRIARFNARIAEALAAGEAEPFRKIIERYETEHNVPAVEIAAALASIAQGNKPLLMDAKQEPRSERSGGGDPSREKGHEPRAARPNESGKSYDKGPRGPRDEGSGQGFDHEGSRGFDRESGRDKPRGRDSEEMETYRVEVGRVHGVEPGNIVGAIANEADLPGKRIGRIAIREDHSFVDLPAGMPKEVFLKLQKVVIGTQKLQISRALKSHVTKLRHGSKEHSAPVERGERPVRKPHRKGKPPPRE